LPVLRRQMTVFASGGRRQAWSKVDRHILVPTRYSVGVFAMPVDVCNWGTEQTSAHVHVLGANGSEADIAFASAEV
jgi:hypothetical protein